jgi:hypothetical protein
MKDRTSGGSGITAAWHGVGSGAVSGYGGVNRASQLLGYVSIPRDRLPVVEDEVVLRMLMTGGQLVPLVCAVMTWADTRWLPKKGNSEQHGHYVLEVFLGFRPLDVFNFFHGGRIPLMTSDDKEINKTAGPQDTAENESPASKDNAPIPTQITPTPKNPHHPCYCRYEPEAKWIRRLEAAAFVAVIVYTVITIALLCATKESLEWIKNQTRQSFSRPVIWVKMPDTVQITPNEPITLDIQVFNYGDRTGLARARIRFEAGPGLIAKWSDLLRHHEWDFSVPDQLGMLSVPITPLVGKHFPLETQTLILSKQNIDLLKTGAIDVVAYGRIQYTDLDYSAFGKRNDHYESKFCFYVMRDGTTLSACPNKYQEYTNWAP